MRYFFVSLIICVGCNSKLLKSDSPPIPACDTIELVINALDLSEDMSVLSTKNDELLFLVYEDEDSILSSPLFMEESMLDEKERTANSYFKVKQLPTALLLVL